MLLNRVYMLENYDGKETVTVSTVLWLAFKLNCLPRNMCCLELFNPIMKPVDSAEYSLMVAG